jgi:drug/metabolite transporter (DMT)-like permease
MQYNFHLLAIIGTIIAVFQTFLKKDILNDCSIAEEVIFTTFFLLCSYIIIYMVHEKKTFKDFFNKLQSNKNNIFYKLLLFDILIVISVFIGGTILKNENIIKSSPYKTGLYLIFIILFTYLFAKEQLSFYKIIGIAVIIGGMCLLNY